MTLFSPYATTTTYDAPHHREAEQWMRFAAVKGFRFSSIEPTEEDEKEYKETFGREMTTWQKMRFGQRARKERALRWNKRTGTAGLAFQLETEHLPGHDRGLCHLMARSQGKKEGFVEVEGRAAYNEEADRDELELLLHRRTRAGSPDRLCVGRVASEDARWILALLGEALPLRFYLVGISFVSASKAPHEVARMKAVVSGSPAAARAYIDAADDRKQQRRERHMRSRPQRQAVCVVGAGAGYAGRDANRDVQRLQREISQFEIEGASRERARLDCSSLNRYIKRRKADLARLKSHAHRDRMDLVEQPTIEDWLRSQPGCSVETSANTVALTDLEAADYWTSQHQI